MNELEIFAAAISAPNPREREELLEQHCADHPEQRKRIEQLLQAHFAAQPVLDDQAPGPTANYIEPFERADAVIGGKYTLIEPIGEGGMGAIWRAKQSEPVKRFVAIKFIKAGMDSKQVMARFDAERQALALMDHPNIAKVLDGGLHAGRPYFIMELVKGVPITEFCDVRKLTPKERLELFIPVCHAIQHAHQKGLIHRDIKPTNVLVALYDDRPVVKVIDFGVAKATGGALSEASIDTGLGAVVGTPQYMSPEQATFNNLDIDTRTDVYALGVLLYELLTGSPPFSRKELEKLGLLEMLRIVRDEEPPRPSTKLSSSEALPTISANRGTEPRKLAGLLRNELDWIVMKALEKDRSRRYETANGFASDVQRYLSGEAVQAHPPSAVYQFRKFVRKHKVPVMAASLVLLLLLLGVGGTSIGLVQVNAARATAEQKETEANAMLKFFDDHVFAAARPKDQDYGLGYNISLLEAIETSLPALATSFADQPLVEARLRTSLGKTFSHLGDFDKSTEQHERASAILGQHYPADHPSILTSKSNLAISYAHLNRHKEALTLFEETLAKRKQVLPENHPDILISMNNLANWYAAINRQTEAVKLFEQTQEIQKRVLAPDHEDTLRTMNNLAMSYSALNRCEEARRDFENVLARRKKILGPFHPDTLMTMNNLASCYGMLGRYSDAVNLLKSALEEQERTLPSDHPATLLTKQNLATAFAAMNLQKEAQQLREETLAARTRALPKNHPLTLTSMNDLALSYAAANRPEDATRLLRETLELRKKALPPNHPDTLMSMNNLASAYGTAHRYQEAIRLLKETLELRKKASPPNHPDTLMTMSNLARGYLATNQRSAALALYQQTLALSKEALPSDHPATLTCLSDLANCYAANNNFSEALKLHEEALVARRRVLVAGHPHIFDSMGSLVLVLSALNQDAEAIPLIDEIAATATGPSIDPSLVPTMLTLRMQHFQKSGDAQQCQTTAQIWEKCSRQDAPSLYQAACFRAIAAAVQAQAKTADAKVLAQAEADAAMSWLRKAIDAGWSDHRHMKQDGDLHFLRGRDDYQKLIAELEGNASTQ